MAGMRRRDVELDFHQSFSAHYATSDYITSGTTDPYKEVTQCASSVLAQEIIAQQYSTPPHQRKECTKFMRLTACEDVDAVETSKI